MRRTKAMLSILAVMTLLSGFTSDWSAAMADTANAPSLTISQLKITSSNGQFITLHNTTDLPLDMSKYQLQYFNSYDLGKATSSRLITLSGIVPPHGYYMVNDSALLLCYQIVVESVSLGLSSTAGLVQILAYNQSGPGLSSVPVLQDYVAWSKTAVKDVQTLPVSTSAFLRRIAESIDKPGAGVWQAVQPAPSNTCELTTMSGESVSPETGPALLLEGPMPPVTILNLSADSSSPVMAAIPPANIGLMAPRINELMPNPEGTGNDSTDEYIELYNPNPVSFDLSNSSLQSGTTSLRKYIFPAGTMLPAGSFTAFYSEATGLSLSNTRSQVKLLDPLGNSISAVQEYASAKDGQAWALANGKWYWTTSATPNAANVIKQPVSAKKSAAASKKSKSSTVASKSPSSKSGSAASTSTSFAEEPPTTPIHTKTLALVGGLALLYGAYEYRTDVANKLYQLKRYFGSRLRNRTEV